MSEFDNKSTHISIQNLPIPNTDQVGFPWTEGSTRPPQYKTENLPKISIITPSFNQGKYIEETIRSVLRQNYPNLEYIIIDGGSTDETVNIIKKYEKWLTYWVSEPDKGQSDAINKGLARATGDVFNWLNSDDVYLPNILLAVGQYFEDKDLNILCGREYLWYSDEKKVLTPGTLICNTLEETIAMEHIQQPPTFFRLPIVKRLGGVDNRLYFCMDAELWVNYLTCFGLKGIKKVDLITNLFRMHEAAKTANTRSIYFKDRTNIIISLLSSLELPNLPKLKTQKKQDFSLYFSKTYKFSPIINQNLLAIHCIERLLNFGIQYLSWRVVFQLYFYLLRIKPFGWHWKLYAAPLIKIKRLFKPL